MSRPIEDYALLGDSATAALVSRTGSIDWWCPPRFDAPACFAALLGGPGNGRWRLGPAAGDDEPVCTRRSYRDDTLVLDTEWTTETGVLRVTDLLAADDHVLPTLVRIASCPEGEVALRMHLTIRFDYGRIVPWVRSIPGGIHAVGGADALTLQTELAVRGEGRATVASTVLTEGERRAMALTWHPSHAAAVQLMDPYEALARTTEHWSSWSSRCRYHGPWAREVRRSLLVLKALTHEPTGGIVAAPTTSLPEQPGGVRNWDYRYCWLRDGAFTVSALLDAGYPEEATAWGRWLRRAIAGDPNEMQIMYGVAGERRLSEIELPWLDGHGGARPVRIGNAASGQRQLDVYGEVFDVLHTLAVRQGHLEPDAVSAARVIVDRLAGCWDEPDDGIWEVRGGRRHFTHSKVMAWVAIDRWQGIVEALGLDDDLGPWRQLAERIHADVCERGWNAEVGAFTQSYGDDVLDASLLTLPLVGFLPPGDPRVVATVDAIVEHLVVDGFVCRYRTEAAGDGLPPGEGAFLLTTCWLVEALAMMGRHEEAQATFERVLGVANDVGLLAEEVDPTTGAHLGNFPQAFSHLGVIISAMALAEHGGPVERRRRLAEHPAPEPGGEAVDGDGGVRPAGSAGRPDPSSRDAAARR